MTTERFHLSGYLLVAGMAAVIAAIVLLSHT